jgi:hypothetical protein
MLPAVVGEQKILRQTIPGAPALGEHQRLDKPLRGRDLRELTPAPAQR